MFKFVNFYRCSLSKDQSNLLVSFGTYEPYMISIPIKLILNIIAKSQKKAS